MESNVSEDPVAVLARIIYGRGPGQDELRTEAARSLGAYLDNPKAVAALDYLLLSNDTPANLRLEVIRILGKRR